MEAAATKGFWRKMIESLTIRATRRNDLPAPKADIGDSQSGGTGYSRIIYTHSYDGEKNFGEIGPARSYLPNYQLLRVRSWQAYLESEIAQTVISRLATWVVGEGLKLQSEPNVKVLKAFGIDINSAEFSEHIESFYSLYAESCEADHAKMLTKNELAMTAFINAIVGGDVLVFLRYDQEEGIPTIQLIDGAHVSSPYGGNEIYAPMTPAGNRIENGIELSGSNEHIAFWVKKPGYTLDWERIPAKSPATGLKVAFLVYGSKYRLDNHRGIPIIAVVLETIKKLERYKEAEVGSAEERAKIAYFIEHGSESDGQNPLAQQAAKMLGYDGADKGGQPVDDVGNKMADKIATTTNKMTFNLPIASTMKALDSKIATQFKDFYSTNSDILCACVGIPPNVAMMKYDSNYSASRAAIQDWAHILRVRRKYFWNQFERPVFTFWFHISVFQGLIQAPGFLLAWAQKKVWVVAAFLKCRFVGANVPHIDPLKEVNAIRAKLGSTGLALPLTTLEAATEEVSGGASMDNMEQYAQELKRSKELDLEDPASVVPEPATDKPAD